MDDLEPELKIVISNDKSYFEIHTKKISLEELKKKCQIEFKYDEKDIEKMDLWYIDDDKDKNLINNGNDLFIFAKEIDSSKFSINLALQLSNKINIKEEKIEDQKNKEKNNFIDDANEGNNEEKDIEIKKLQKEIDFLKEEINYHKQRNKNIILKYEEILNEYRVKNKSKEINEISDNNNNEINNINSLGIKDPQINYNDTNGYNNKEIYENEKKQGGTDDGTSNNLALINQYKNYSKNQLLNNNNLNEINMNNKLKDNRQKYNLKNLEFINNKCKKCEKKAMKSIFKCVICDNYYLCEACQKSNSKYKFHEHNEYFHIIYPNGVQAQLGKKENDNIKFNQAVSSFYTLLKEIFFDKNYNIITKEISNKEIKNLTKICKQMDSLNAPPLEYFSEYQKIYINRELKNDEKLKEIIFQKINIIVNNISKISSK